MWQYHFYRQQCHIFTPYCYLSDRYLIVFLSKLIYGSQWSTTQRTKDYFTRFCIPNKYDDSMRAWHNLLDNQRNITRSRQSRNCNEAVDRTGSKNIIPARL
ncbi:hypothetical protein BS78_02G174600 [Paspalum vaginatum]|nr:hypothetical protein BS78_02G174600 [Paspalum vaginatum]